MPTSELLYSLELFPVVNAVVPKAVESMLCKKRKDAGYGSMAVCLTGEAAKK